MSRHAISLLGVAVVVACGGSAERVSDDLPKPPSRTAHVPGEPIHAIHGGTISLMAIDQGGDAAVTADDVGGVRIWPAFDGVREPFVIDAPPPRALAIVREADGGFAVADLDRAGFVSIGRWTAAGVRRGERVQLEASAVALAATAQSFVVVGDDSTVATVAASGRAIGKAASDPGTRIARVIAAGARAVAIVESEHGLAARWLDAATGAWGAAAKVPESWTAIDAKGDERKAALAALAARAVVSADGGTLHGVAPCDANAGGDPLGFIDDKTLACLSASTGAVTWWRDGKQVAADSGQPTVGAPSTIAVGKGVVAIAFQTQLALATPAHLEFLGYDNIAFPDMRITERGVVVGRGEASARILDRGFAVVREIAVPEVAATGEGAARAKDDDAHWLDLAILDAHAVAMIVESPRGRALTIYDLDRRASGPSVAVDGTLGSDVAPFAYEAASGLLLVGRDRAGNAVARAIDPTTRAIGPAIVLGAPFAWLVDPARADGAAIVTAKLGAKTGELAIEEVAVARGGKLEVKRSYAIAGAVRAVDRTARIYVAMGGTEGSELDGAPDGDIQIYERGEIAAAELAGQGGASVYPDPSGELVAVATRKVVALYGRDGKQRWMIAAPGAQELAWIDGGIVGRFASGFARIEAASGELAARRCGWGFGKYATPRSTVPDEPTVCDQ